MLSNLKQEIYFITGPTAIGKSSLAINLAKKINGVIINSDSMQVYSNLRILTARPTVNDHKEIKHNLYGYVDASKRYNVANWCNDILEIIKVNEINNIPSIVVGGGGMYIHSLLNGLIDFPEISEKYKLQSAKLLDHEGFENFINIISKIDPNSLKNISVVIEKCPSALVSNSLILIFNIG